MVEGHTDNVPINIDGIADNWDLSVKRAVSIVRILQKNDFGVAPERMTAAGRSQYIPFQIMIHHSGEQKIEEQEL